MGDPARPGRQRARRVLRGRATSRPRTASASSSTTGAVRTDVGPRSPARARSPSTCSLAGAASRARRGASTTRSAPPARAGPRRVRGGRERVARPGATAARRTSSWPGSCRNRGNRGTAARCSSSATSCSRTGRRSCGAVASPALLGRDGRHARRERRPARRIPLIVPPGDARSGPARTDADGRGLDDVVAAMGAVAEAGRRVATRGPCTGHAPRPGSRCSPAIPHRARRDPRASTRSATSRATSSTRSACPSSASPASRTSGTTSASRWCVTNANGDYQDLYVERFAPGDPSRCEFAGGWRDVAPSRGRAGARRRRRSSVDCFETHHGPVVFGDPSTGWCDRDALDRARRAQLRARGARTDAPGGLDVDELDDVMRDWVDPVNNLVSADVDGHIAYRTVGRIPVRSTGERVGSGPGLDGRPRLGRRRRPTTSCRTPSTPRAASIVTANQRIVGADYPHYLGLDYARPDRAQRSRDRLERLARRDRRRHGRDPPRPAFARRRPVGRARLSALAPADEREAAALDAAARAWDRVMDPESAGAAVYVVTRDAVCRHRRAPPGAATRLRVPFADEPPGTYQPLELRLWTALAGSARGRRHRCSWPRADLAGVLADALDRRRGRCCAPRSATTPGRGGGARCTASAPRPPALAVRTPSGTAGSTRPPWRWAGNGTPSSPPRTRRAPASASPARRSPATCSTSPTGTRAAGSCPLGVSGDPDSPALRRPAHAVGRRRARPDALQPGGRRVGRGRRPPGSARRSRRREQRHGPGGRSRARAACGSAAAASSA